MNSTAILPSLKVLNTLLNRAKIDVEVSVKLSSILGDIRAEDIELHALKSVMLIAQDQLQTSVRKQVYAQFRNLLQDSEAISIHLQQKGFSIEQLVEDLKKVKEYVALVEYQPEEKPNLPEDLSHVKINLTDEGLQLEELPDIQTVVLPIIKYGVASSDKDLTVDSEGNLVEYPISVNSEE